MIMSTQKMLQYLTFFSLQPEVKLHLLNRKENLRQILRRFPDPQNVPLFQSRIHGALRSKMSPDALECKMHIVPACKDSSKEESVCDVSGSVEVPIHKEEKKVDYSITVESSVSLIIYHKKDTKPK